MTLQGLAVADICGRNNDRLWYNSCADFLAGGWVSSESLAQLCREFLPYAVDQDGQALLYANYRDQQSLVGAPFFHQEQYQQADKLLRLPFSQLDNYNQHLESTVQPVFIFSIGRCGSTLLSAMFKAANIVSLSEPDIYTGFTQWMQTESDVELKNKVSAVATNSLLQLANGNSLAIKLRSQCNVIAHEVMTSFPDAPAFMLLRDEHSWSESIYRAFNWTGAAAARARADAMIAMHLCEQADIPLHVLWYEDLITSPETVLKKIVGKQQGGRAIELNVEMLEHIVGSDSQQGTQLAREQLGREDVPQQFRDEFNLQWQREMQQLRNAGIKIASRKRPFWARWRSR